MTFGLLVQSVLAGVTNGFVYGLVGMGCAIGIGHRGSIGGDPWEQTFRELERHPKIVRIA